MQRVSKQAVNITDLTLHPATISHCRPFSILTHDIDTRIQFDFVFLSLTLWYCVQTVVRI